MLGELPEPGQAALEQLPPAAGLIPRVLAHLFGQVARLQQEQRVGREVAFSVSCSLLEIYKEQVRVGRAGWAVWAVWAGNTINGDIGRWAGSLPSSFYMTSSLTCPPSCILSADHGPGVGCRPDHAARGPAAGRVRGWLVVALGGQR